MLKSDRQNRRRPEPKKRRPTTITVPSRVGPHVRLVFTEMQRQNITYDEVEEGSGFRRAGLKAWRHKNRPNLDSIEAVLNYLGWEIVPVPTARVLPEEIVEALQPIADRLGLEIPYALNLVAEIAYRDKHYSALQAVAKPDQYETERLRTSRTIPHADPATESVPTASAA